MIYEVEIKWKDKNRKLRNDEPMDARDAHEGSCCTLLCDCIRLVCIRRNSHVRSVNRKIYFTHIHEYFYQIIYIIC